MVGGGDDHCPFTAPRDAVLLLGGVVDRHTLADDVVVAELDARVGVPWYETSCGSPPVTVNGPTLTSSSNSARGSTRADAAIRSVMVNPRVLEDAGAIRAIVDCGGWRLVKPT